MPYTTYPITPDIRANIDSVSIGALRSFSERCDQELQLLSALNETDTLFFNRNAKKYTVELQYILPLGCGAVDMPDDPVSLGRFTLEIYLADRTLRFEDCVYESVQTSCEVGGSLLCTMRILSLNRQCINETG